ncbi:MAG TPA: phosphoenolpyruvate carboxykinase (ATP), partial [Candidatus Hydrogenedentes bacterium]|nr:phosphoenolpyruvate carboxykinase (ATP) [Candidatus Hydrogenedentota bacterium]
MTIDLSRHGITSHGTIYRNPSYDTLFEHETNPALEGLERGVVTRFGAVAVDTGRFTGRSPQDKYFVEEETSRDNLWWEAPENPGSNNKRMSEETWRHLRKIATDQLNGKDLYVIDGFVGTNPSTRLRIRVVTEVAWLAHFSKNMFIRPTEEELRDFEPDWTVLNACKTTCKDYQQYGMRSEVFAAFNIKERMT